jgi:hypothetical protein
MNNYFKLIDLKNIFLKKINKLDIHFQQYGGINFDDEIKKYKNYNSNLDIINRHIDVLLTIKYVEYLIYLIKSFKGVGSNIFLTKLKDKLNKVRSDNIIKLRDIITNFIIYDREKNNINNTSNISSINNTSNISSINNTSNVSSINNTSNISSINNTSNISSINNMYDELNIYRQHNNELFQIIINNETKIKDLSTYLKLDTNLILSDVEYKQEKINIQTKFIFLLGIIKELFEFIILIKDDKKTIFNNLVINIFTYCDHSVFYENNEEINKKITEICRQITSINSKI